MLCQGSTVGCSHWPVLWRLAEALTDSVAQVPECQLVRAALLQQPDAAAGRRPGAPMHA